MNWQKKSDRCRSTTKSLRPGGVHFFRMNFINRVRALDPSAKVYYLSGDLAPEALHAVGAAGIDYHFNVIYKHPEWVDIGSRFGDEGERVDGKQTRGYRKNDRSESRLHHYRRTAFGA